MALVPSDFLPLSTPCFDLPVFSVSHSNSLSLLKHSWSWRKYFTSPLLAKKASWGFSMSQWSSEESKVASISLKMGDSTFIFMISATCHLQIVFGRLLYVVLLVSCFVYRVGEKMQYLFKKCCPYGIGYLLFYIMSPPSQNISTSKKSTLSSNQQFDPALGTYQRNELLHGGHAMTKSCLASTG